MSRIRVVRDRRDGQPNGLPAALPAGETMLWQGAPNWFGLARRVLHVRKIAVYFAILAVWCAGSAILTSSPRLWYSLVALIIFGFIAIGMLCIFAWLIARTTVYTLTDRRIVLKIGVALSISLNLPFRQIDSASLRLYPDGTGDIPLLMNGPTRMGITLLWPHVRPWRLQRVQPMLRAIPDAARVARLLGTALAANAGKSEQVASVSAPIVKPQPAHAGWPASVGA
jgi:hypothetical protein